MAIGVIWYPPIDQQIYDAVRERVTQASVDKGLTFHAAGEADGSWRIIECWDSREALESFIREDLHPAVDEVSGGQAPHPRPRTRLRRLLPGPVGAPRPRSLQAVAWGMLASLGED